MAESVKNRMDTLSEKIDQRVNKEDKQIPFRKHFHEWWNSLNTGCGNLYSEAGQESPPSINPEDARKWLNEQITKLNDFLSTMN